MEDVYKVLEEFGLTHNEVKTYLALLKSGAATASEIASKTGIHRINMYDILNKLQEKSIITQIVSERQKYYEAIHPREFDIILNERKKELAKITPHLVQQMNLAKHPQDATLISTKKGIKLILQEIAETSKEMLHFASANYQFGVYFPEYHEVWPQRLYEHGVLVRSLHNPKARTLKQHKVYHRRFYPENFDFPSTTVIYNNNVFIIIWEAGPTGILIRNKAVAESYKHFFEMLWKISKE